MITVKVPRLFMHKGNETGNKKGKNAPHSKSSSSVPQPPTPVLSKEKREELRSIRANGMKTRFGTKRAPAPKQEDVPSAPPPRRPITEDLGIFADLTVEVDDRIVIEDGQEEVTLINNGSRPVDVTPQFEFGYDMTYAERTSPPPVYEKSSIRTRARPLRLLEDGSLVDVQSTFKSGNVKGIPVPRTTLTFPDEISFTTESLIPDEEAFKKISQKARAETIKRDGTLTEDDKAFIKEHPHLFPHAVPKFIPEDLESGDVVVDLESTTFPRPNIVPKYKEKRVVYDPLVIEGKHSTAEFSIDFKSRVVLAKLEAHASGSVKGKKKKDFRATSLEEFVARKQSNALESGVRICYDSKDGKYEIPAVDLVEHVNFRREKVGKKPFTFPSKRTLQYMSGTIHATHFGTPDFSYFYNVVPKTRWLPGAGLAKGVQKDYDPDRAGELFSAWLFCHPKRESFRWSWLQDEIERHHGDVDVKKFVDDPSPRVRFFVPGEGDQPDTYNVEERSFAELTRMMLEACKLKDIPFVDDLINAPSLFMCVATLFQYVYWDSEMFEDNIRLMFQMVSIYASEVRKYAIKSQMKKREYAALYNREFGKFIHTDMVQTELRRRGENADNTDIFHNLAGAHASEEATRKAKTAVFTARGESRERKVSKLRDQKRLDQLMYEQMDPPPPPPPRSKIERIADHAKAGFSGGFDLFIDMFKSIGNTVLASIEKMFPALKEVWNANVLLLQSRMFNILHLFMALRGSSVFEVIMSLTTVLASFYPLTALPSFVSNMISSIKDYFDGKVKPEPTGKEKVRIGNNDYLMTPSEQKSLVALLTGIREAPSTDQVAHWPPPLNEIEKDLFKYASAQSNKMYSESAVQLYNILGRTLIGDPVREHQQNFEWLSLFCSSTNFLKTIVDMLGLTTFLSHDHKELDRLSKIVSLLNNGGKLMTSASDLFQSIVSSIFTSLFDYDPFDGQRTTKIALSNTMHDFFFRTDSVGNTEQSDAFIRKYRLAQAFLSKDYTELPAMSKQRLAKIVSERYSLYRSCLFDYMNPNPRKPPLCVLFLGTAGTGKSQAMENWIRALYELLYSTDAEKLTYNEGCVFPLPSHDNFYFEQYNPSKMKFVTAEEVYSAKVDEAYQAYNSFLMNAVSNNRYRVPMAFESKGLVSFEAEFISMTSNLFYANPATFCLESPEAISRRIRMFILVADKKADDDGVPFFRQTFHVFGEMVLQWATATNVPVRRSHNAPWNAMRHDEMYADYCVSINGEQLLLCTMWIKEQWQLTTTKARIDDNALLNYLTKIRNNNVIVGGTISDVKVMPKSIDLSLPEIADAYSKAPIEKFLDIDQYEPPVSKKKNKQREHMGKPQKSADVFAECMDEFEPDIPTQDSVFTQVKTYLGEHPVQVCLVSLCLVAAPLIYKYMRMVPKTAAEQEQSPNLYNKGRIRVVSPTMHTGPVAPIYPVVQQGFDLKAQGLGAAEPVVNIQVADAKSRCNLECIFTDEAGQEFVQPQVHGVYVGPYCIMVVGHLMFQGKLVACRMTDCHGTIDLNVTRVSVFMEYDLCLFVLDPDLHPPHASVVKPTRSRFAPAYDPATLKGLEFSSLARSVVVCSQYDPTSRMLYASDKHVKKVGESIYWNHDETRQTTVRRTLRFDAASNNGDCGTLYYAQFAGTAFIVGFHVCGHESGGSGATFLTDDMIRGMIAIAYGKDDPHLEASPPDLEQKVSAVPKEFEHLGAMINMAPQDTHMLKRPVLYQVHDKLKNNTPFRTKYSASPMHTINAALGVEPDQCLLDPTPRYDEKEGRFVDPLRESMAKKEHIPHSVGELLFQDKISDWFYSLYPPTTDPRVLSIQEAIDGGKFAPPLTKVTSGGWPFCKGPKGSQKKAHILPTSTQEHTYFDDDYMIPLNERLELLKLGERSPTVFMDTFKDETRPYSWKIRNFAAGPVDLIIAQRMYFQTFADHVASKCVEAPVSVGIDVHTQWENLIQRLTRRTSFGIGTDYKRYDSTLPWRVLHFCMDLICGWYQGHERLARMTLLWEIMNPFFIYLDKIYAVVGSNPSGQALTSIINSICNMIILATVCILLYPPTNLIEDVEMAIYGDDNVVFHAFITVWTGIEAIIKERFGMIITDASKDLSKEIQSQSIWEMSFMSRSFSVINGQIQAPLPLARIVAMLTYMKRWDPKNIESTLSSAAIELTHHPRSNYESFYKWARAHTYVLDNHLQVWMWKRAFSARHGTIIHATENHKQSDIPINLEYVCMHEQTQCVRNQSVVKTKTITSRTPGDISQITSQSNPITTRIEPFTEFIGDGPKIETAPIQVSTKLPFSGPTQTYEGICDRAFLIGSGTWGATTSAFATLNQMSFPYMLFNEPEIKKCLAGAENVTWDEICLWVTVRQPAFTAGKLCLTAGPADVCTSYVHKSIRTSMVYVDADMSEENCLSLPWCGYYPITSADVVADPDPSAYIPYSPYTRATLFCLHPLVSAVPSVAAMANYQIWAKIKGLKTVGNNVFANVPTVRQHEQSGRPVRVSASQLRKLLNNDFSDDEEAQQAETSTELVHTAKPSPPQLKVATSAPPLMGPVSGAASAVEKVAAVVARESAELGLSKPLVETKVPEMVFGHTTDRGDGDFRGFNAAQRTHQKLDSCCYDTVGKDQTSFAAITQIPTLVYSGTLEVGNPLYHNVTPCVLDIDGAWVNDSTTTGSPAWSAIPSLTCRYWDGGVNIMLYFTAPTGTVATVQLSYIPDVTLATSSPIQWPNTVMKQIIQVDEHAVIKFNVPYTNVERWKQSVPMPFIANPTVNVSYCTIGLLKIEMLSLSAIAPLTTTSVYMDVFTAAASDMRWAVFNPQDPTSVSQSPMDLKKKEKAKVAAPAKKPTDDFEDLMYEQINPFKEYAQGSNFKIFSPQMQVIIPGNMQYGAELIDSLTDVLKRPFEILQSSSSPQATTTPIMIAAGDFTGTNVTPGITIVNSDATQWVSNPVISKYMNYILTLYARGLTSRRYTFVQPVNSIAVVTPNDLTVPQITSFSQSGAFALFDLTKTNRVDIQIPFKSDNYYGVPNTDWSGTAAALIHYDIDTAFKFCKVFHSFGDDLYLAMLRYPGPIYVKNI